eukprot:6256877-Lingulodinium_polyedra.AAC.1
MLDLRFMRATLERANAHHNVRTGVRKVGNCTKQRHVQLVQLLTALVLWLGANELWVCNATQVAGEQRRVQ